MISRRELWKLRSRAASRPFARPVPAARPVPRIAIRPLVLYAGFALLFGTNVLTLVGLLMAPDIARLFAGQNDGVLTAYEERISQLRVEVDRLQSRHYAQAGDINLQLQDLAQTQELLLEQHQYVKQLADKAAELGIETAVAATDAPPPLLTSALTPGADAATQIGSAAAAVDRMLDESRLALTALSEAATSKTDAIVATLADVGIRARLPVFDGVGGPLLPPVDGAESSSLVDDANAVAEALERFSAARAAVDSAPIHRPIAADARTSSPFGNRKDPFTGRLAFHSGLDWAAARGSTVMSAGAGKVTFVGQINGYGNVVEITHPSGLVSRYAHLSAFLVKEGRTVGTGTPIARVGSTGRSTGPHLHFEVRRADRALDPVPYINAGKKLTAIIAG
jgi:murein DD-endopeptidase MepM/ murein hydrolase activator NlpD